MAGDREVPEAGAVTDPAPQKRRKRDRVRAASRRYMRLPLAFRTSDLPKRAASALVMVTIAAIALALGGLWLDGFIALVALVCFFEFCRLVLQGVNTMPVRFSALVGGAIYIGLAAAILMRIDHRPLILLIVAMVICVDTFAYFFGRTFGGPKIAPRISPSKTWAGLIGGAIGACVAIASYFMTGGWGLHGEVRVAAGDWPLLLAVGAVVAICAQSGDFFESFLKRKAKRKDSSSLIPGHGGVFDRIDGLLPVAIIFGGMLVTMYPQWSV